MGLRINNNIAAQNAYRNLSVTDGQMSKSLEKLSSGFRINRAADDAAGLSISEGLRSQIGGLKVAVRNAPSAVCTTEMPSCALRTATFRPPICERRPSLIDRPAASSAARLIRKPDDSFSSDLLIWLSVTDRFR